MPQRSSPGGPQVGATATPKGGRGFHLGSADGDRFGQDRVSVDEPYERLYPVSPKLEKEESAEQYASRNNTNQGLCGGNAGDYAPDSYIDPGFPRGVGDAVKPDFPSDVGLQENSYAPGKCDLALEGPFQHPYDLGEDRSAANHKGELENNTTPEFPTTRHGSSSVISISSTETYLPSPGTSGALQLSPTPAADTPSKRRTRGTSEMDLSPAPADANPKWDQRSRNRGQSSSQTSRSLVRRAPVGDLADVGCVLVVQKIKDSGVEVPILYTIYEPLRDWGQFGQFKYTSHGNLNQDVTFDEESLHDFIYNHPMQQNLTLRIERHPYGFQCRYRNPRYIKCRAKKCSVDETKSFKVGDFRIAVDEVTGRLGANQFNDNDPYFSACFFHLQCFENLTDTPDLVRRNLIVVDDRGFHSKEPECTRINKMGVAPATVATFNKWRETAIKKRSEDVHWQPQGNETLAAAIWLSGIRKGRKRVRAPPGITTEDIERKCSTHPGWGGKRVSGLSVAAMTLMEDQGRSGEMIASRNGKTGKRGVREPERITRKRLLSETGERDPEGIFALAGSSPEGNSTRNTPETEGSTCSGDCGYPLTKRSRSSATPENSPREESHGRSLEIPHASLVEFISEHDRVEHKGV